MDKHLIHKHSSVAGKEIGLGKIEFGEIAVNYAVDQENITIKNSDNKLVKFLTEKQVNDTFVNVTGDTMSGNLNVEANVSIGTGNTFASGATTRKYAFAQGDSCIAIGDWSHAEGFMAEANGDGSHAEGLETQAKSDYSHAEGYKTQTRGVASHAEGLETQAIGGYSHTEGLETQAKSDYSHAEGYKTQTRGVASHAEGLETQTIGGYSHAEGYKTQTRGVASHAEGLETQAIGGYSHAEGESTEAKGWASHAEGVKTIANNYAEHANGAYNVSISGTSQDLTALTADTQATLFSVGNGVDDQNRRNAFEVKYNGDTYFSGNTKFDKTVNVKGATELGSTLLVKGNTTINSKLKVDGTTSLQATTATTISATSITVPTINATTITATTGNITNVNSTTVTAVTGNITTVNSTTVTSPNVNSVTLTAKTIDATTVTAPNINSVTITATTGNITNVNSTTVTAATGNITTVNATNVNANTITAATGNITTVNSTTGNITNVIASDVTTDTLDVTSGIIDSLGCTTITATTGNITNVNSTTVTAVTGNITTVNATNVNANTITATTGNITNVIASDVTTDTLDVTSGTIDTLTSTTITVPTIKSTNISATTVTAPNLVGNSSTATKLQTARTIALSGDVTGTTSFDGSGNVTIASVITPLYAASPSKGGPATSANKVNSTLSFASGTFAAKTFNGSAAVTVNVPTHTSHLSNNSDFATNASVDTKITASEIHLTGVTGSANGTMTFAKNQGTALTFDSTHTHPTSEVTGLDTKITTITNSINSINTTLGNGVVLTKVSPLKYNLLVDNVEKGVIDIPKDQFLNKASYDTTTNELVFNFTTSGGATETRIGVGHLIDTYTAGNGLLLADNKFSIDTSVTATKDYVNTGLNGKSDNSHGHVIGDVSGLQTALDGKQASGSYASSSHNHSGTYANASHTHTIANVTNLQTTLDGKSGTGHTHNYAAASHSHSDYASTSHSHSQYVLKAGDTMTGSLTVQGTISATSQVYSSDISLKENIEVIKDTDIEAVRTITPKAYAFKEDMEHRVRYGTIAQEVEQTSLSELVYEDEMGIKGVDYISYLIIKCEQLQRDLNSLQNKFDELSK